MRRFAVRSVLIIVVVCIGGCAILFSYRNIERWIRWSIDDYVMWTPTQAEDFDQRLHRQLQWHQQTELPRYREWLLAARDAVRTPLDLDTLNSYSEQLPVFWQRSMLHGEEDIAALLAQLSDDQVRDLIAEMHSRQQDIEDEFNDLSPAELIERRERNMSKALRYFFGTLDASQRVEIERWAKSLPDSRVQWLASRRRWTDQFEQGLAQRHQPEIFAEQIHKLFVLPQQSWDPDYREISAHNLTASLQLLVALQHSLSEQQRKKLDQRIEQWLDRLDTLASSS